MKADREEFQRLIERFRFVQVERDIMRNLDAPKVDRDLATARFHQLSDGLVEQLERMSEAGTLGRIALTLGRRAA